jgi:hypothetical protein
MAPSASPLFTYAVTTNWMAYQEALWKVSIQPLDMPTMRDRSWFVLAGVGVAETSVSVNGKSGAFSVTDNAARPGLTVSAGIGVPVAMLPGGVGVDAFAQWRGTQWSGNVSIPGSVPISGFVNEVDVGLTFNFAPPPPP